MRPMPRTRTRQPTTRNKGSLKHPWRASEQSGARFFCVDAGRGRRQPRGRSGYRGVRVIMDKMRMALLAVLLLGTTGCGESEPTHRPSDKTNQPRPTLEEQQSAARDPLHRSYEKLLRAAYNLGSCERDGDPLVVSVVRERMRAEEMAKTKGFGPTMALAERIVLFHMESELHAKCYPNFASALREMDQAVQGFRDQVERLPRRTVSGSATHFV